MDCKENGVSDPSGNANSPAHDIDLITSLAIPQVASVVNPTMEVQKDCVIEIEQTGDGNSISKEHEEKSDAVCCIGNDSQKPGVVSDEVEQTQGSVSDAVVSGGTILPVGVSETDTESVFVNDAPEKFESLETEKDKDVDEVGSDAPEKLESLETAKDKDVDEVGCDALNSTFDDGGKEGRKEPSSDEDAGFSDDISFIRSCPFPDSILDSGVFSCSDTENYLKSSSDIEGNMPHLVSPSLAITEMLVAYVHMILTTS